MELRPRTEKRLIEATTELNEITREAAERYGVACLPVAGHPALRDPATFSADGLHPSSAGHRTVARESARYLHEQLGIDFDMGEDQS
jgi:lysophospholipase L1-like esterase